MNELIKISANEIGAQTVQTTDARELHAFLEIGSAFKDWIARRIEDYGFKDGEDFCSFLSESSGGRPSREYALSLGMAKELAMVERNAKGKQARQYFIECERQLQTGGYTVPKASHTGLPEFRRARALDLATKTAERIAAQFPSLSEDSRRVIFAKVINPVAGIEILALPHVEEKHYTAGQVGEQLGISANMVGRIANLHGLKTKEHGEFRLDKSAHSSKQVESFVYSSNGVEAIRRHLPERPTPTQNVVSLQEAV